MRKGGVLIICNSSRLAKVVYESSDVRVFFGNSCWIHPPKMQKKVEKYDLIVKGVSVDVDHQKLGEFLSSIYHSEVCVERFVTKEKKVLRTLKITCTTSESYDSMLRNGFVIGFEI